MLSLSRLLLVLTALFFSGVSIADTIQGRVVRVLDGDTVSVLDSSNTEHRIRLMGIDAPEKKQPFGQRAKESLSDLVYDKAVVVEYSKKDR